MRRILRKEGDYSNFGYLHFIEPEMEKKER
jgi:hypothetical protein